MTLSAYAMVGVVASIDAAAVRERVAATVPARFAGGFLVATAVLFVGLWSAIVASALARGTTLDPIPRAVVIMDFTVQLPALLVGGALLWRRVAFAYVVVPGLLLQAAAYLLGLAAITVLQSVLTGSAIDPVSTVPGLVVGVVCLALIATFVRGAAAERRIARRPVIAPAVR